MTDYFTTDTAVFYKDDEFYKAAKTAADRWEAKQKERFEKRYGNAA